VPQVSDAHEEKIERSAVLLELDDEFRDSNLPMIERFFQVRAAPKPTRRRGGSAVLGRRLDGMQRREGERV
jgi:hypothetical protein